MLYLHCTTGKGFNNRCVCVCCCKVRTTVRAVPARMKVCVTSYRVATGVCVGMATQGITVRSVGVLAIATFSLSTNDFFALRLLLTLMFITIMCACV